MGILGDLWLSFGAPLGSSWVLGGSLRILGGPLGVPWDPWESLGVPGSPFGVPWGSLGGPLERLGDEGMRWDTKMPFLLSKSKVLGIARVQQISFAL